jgi:hypothetical protein
VEVQNAIMLIAESVKKMHVLNSIQSMLEFFFVFEIHTAQSICMSI